MNAACLLCGGATEQVLGGVRDNRFGSPGEWEIRRCRACGLEQTAPLPRADELKSLYAAHYNYAGYHAGGERGTAYTGWRERFLMSPFYRIMLRLDGDISFHGERGSGCLLDIGCNEGRGLALYRRNGFAVEGLELNPAAAKAARARGFAVHETDIADFRPAAPFDRAVLANVLEHALDPRAMLGHVHRILAPGGEVWISLPNAESWLRRVFGRVWINWHVPFHITHFTAARLGRLLAETGFAPVSVKQATPALWVAQSVIAWLFDGRADEPRKLRSPLWVAGLMLVARGLCFPLLWLGNRLGRGDCLIVKARRA
ncbi:MAG: class I SAM-dependent methyltransferase [Rhodospirillales bacterium]|nr:class I SAM-dependent methyltransferase [Rhodospirillales bacterium]